MKNLVASVIFLVIFTQNCYVYGYNMPDVLTPNEKAKFIAYNVNGNKIRWIVDAKWSKIQKERYHISENGKGSYGHYGNVTWEFSGDYIVLNNNLIPLNTRRIIRNKQGITDEVLEKKYIADINKIKVIKRIGQSVREYYYKISNNFVDSKTLAFALRLCVIEDKEKYIFDYLTDKPGLYTVYIKKIGNEKINGISAVKYRFFPEFNVLNFFAHKLYPKAFIWFSVDYPYQMLKYEGPEMGPFSTKILIKRD